jgi:hypothetical protein
VKCPKCGNECEASGEAIAEGKPVTVYQCDTCVVPFNFDGVIFPSAVTFTVDSDGNVVYDNTSGQSSPSLNDSTPHHN